MKVIKFSNILEQQIPSTSASTGKLEYFNKRDVKCGHDKQEFLLYHLSAIECLLNQYLCLQCNTVDVVKNKIRNRFDQAPDIGIFCENCEMMRRS